MGIQDRKKRQLAEREQFFLDRAWAMIERDGVLKLQMARLASECEYAVGTLYLHFSSKEDLLVALATRTVSKRMSYYERAFTWQAPTRERMLAVIVADVLFAQSSPEYFRLAQYVSTHTIWMAASEQRRAEALAASTPLGEGIVAIVNEAVAAGEVPDLGLSGYELIGGLWAMTEGMHALVSATGLLEAHPLPHPYRLLLRQAHALLNGWGWQSEVPLDAVEQQQQLLVKILTEVFPEVSLAECSASAETTTEK